jgi:hypothetical protein
MDINTYQSNMTILINENVIQNNDYFDYTYSPLKEIYDLFYAYCQTYLDSNSVELKISPAKMYYSNDTTINASADKKNGYFLISINCGTIFHMRSFFLEKKAVFEKEEFNQYSTTIFKSGYQIEDFLTIVLYKFIFHHEIAHLVQKNDEETFSFPEDFPSADNSKFDAFAHHILEFDADWLASCHIVFLILDIIKEAGNDTITKSNLEGTLVLTITGIVTYFTTFNSKRELYFEKEKHPHNFIRLVYITELILPVIIHNTSIQIGSQNILNSVLKLTNLIFQSEEYNPNNDFNSFMKMYLEQGNQIKIYINRIKKAVKNNELLSIRKLNSVDMHGKSS